MLKQSFHNEKNTQNFAENREYILVVAKQPESVISVLSDTLRLFLAHVDHL